MHTICLRHTCPWSEVAGGTCIHIMHTESFRYALCTTHNILFAHLWSLLIIVFLCFCFDGCLKKLYCIDDKMDSSIEYIIYLLVLSFFRVYLSLEWNLSFNNITNQTDKGVHLSAVGHGCMHPSYIIHVLAKYAVKKLPNSKPSLFFKLLPGCKEEFSRWWPRTSQGNKGLPISLFFLLYVIKIIYSWGTARCIQMV